ncbi:hypothetical protein F5Y00DRAFT_200019 [Daldinia vernicosa]|uniref:uncharacterized protein n=1 Tax=Daldinia vernicosa TaxID=114800 RepID=UPI0020089E27|nr:uncharacterized protein F5Y00DRAFT_200019 [Daldinia vernicosa]KAI0844426.1 hypothetical protein F5Y00DRAFT_200019 [Daldinia vernicosa]
MGETRTNSDQPQSQYQSDLSLSQPQQRSSIGFIGREWSANKIVLVSLSIASCAIVLGISIALAVDPDVQSYIVVWTAPQAGAALLWSGIDLATTYAGRINHRLIHPGAQVAVQLLLWMGFCVGIGLTAYILSWALAFSSSDDRDAYPEYYEYYHGDNNDYYEYYSKSYIRSMEALVAFLAILIIVHFLLFFSASMKVARRKKMSSKPITIPLQRLGQIPPPGHEKDNGDRNNTI